jgi:hypothetical protein
MNRIEKLTCRVKCRKPADAAFYAIYIGSEAIRAVGKSRIQV